MQLVNNDDHSLSR